MNGLRFGARFAAPLPRACRAALATAAVLLWCPIQAAPPAPQTAGAAAASSAPARAQGTRVAQAPGAGPAWNELSPQQRVALQPLAGTWATLTEPHKRKWIALSRNYAGMSPQEQAKLHSRMSEWAALSPQQRTQARLNFGQTQGVSPDDKKAKWEAYQALSEEEKRKLAAGANARTPPTAAAVKPVPAEKLTNVPRAERRSSKPPRIASGAADPPQPMPAPPAGTAN
ncbi:DUF3106 domain-containing protein [Ramlibacter henchirensis]|uniref:DUF3106 domain-containing protein n=1 Tax=Ramlibacter henchirensis TaxID=204072 RepID=UPI001F0D0B0B|nr:DUF3106 domain-containing protein [Ramlibacter henchirensis]